MTTLQNRPNTALLVVDVQSGVVDGNHERDTVVAQVSLADTAAMAFTGPPCDCATFPNWIHS